MTITGLQTAGSGHLFRLSSRFLGDNGAGSGRFAVNFYNAGGGLLNITDSTATIDVTGKAGDVYRRVLYKVPIDNAPSSILNYALFSEVGLCQDYGILNDSDTATVGGHCPGGG